MKRAIVITVSDSVRAGRRTDLSGAAARRFLEQAGLAVGEPVVVADLLAGVLDKVVALGDRRWLIETTSNEVVQLDPQRITQALIQLVANALKFTQPDAVIALGGRIYGPEVRLWVRDEGTGIHAEDRSRIFERFGRGSDPIGTQPPGTDDGAGLGLAIVDAIAQAHHGQLVRHSDALGLGFHDDAERHHV